jgi:hypothetical protein
VSKLYGDEYAKVVWRAEDVKYLKPSWTLPQCEEWLQDNQEHMKDRLTELGYEVMDSFLSMEGHDE